jgi:predicted nucleic acid-binding protein
VIVQSVLTAQKVKQLKVIAVTAVGVTRVVAVEVSAIQSVRVSVA